MNSKLYSLRFYPESENPRWDNRYQLRKISPYDESKYYWAYSYNKTDWHVIYNGHTVFSLDNKTENEMIDILEQYNHKIKSRICHN